MKVLVPSVVLALVLVTDASAQQRGAVMLAQEPACQTTKIASAGGPMPKNQNVAVLRYLGTANYALEYRDQVILFDVFFSRVKPARPLGVLPEEFTRANAIFIGHGHWDHIADVPVVAKNTGAKVYGGPPSTAYAVKVGVPENQTVTVKNGDVFTFNGFTVQAIQGLHSLGRPAPVGKMMDLYEETLPELIGYTQTEPEKAQWKKLQSSGAGGPDISRIGTYTYLITFDNGFKIVYTDTAGPTTDFQKEMMAKIGGSSDVAIIAYAGRFNAQRQNQESLPLIKMFNPRVVLPSHHEDESGVGAHFDMPIYPLAMAVRDEIKGAQTIAPLYLSPICFDTVSKDVFVGK